MEGLLDRMEKARFRAGWFIITEELFVVFIAAELPFTQEQSSVVIEPRLVVEEEVALAVQHLKLLRQRLVDTSERERLINSP